MLETVAEFGHRENLPLRGRKEENISRQNNGMPGRKTTEVISVSVMKDRKGGDLNRVH